MNRREFIAGSSLVFGATLARGAPAVEDVSAFKRMVVDYYNVYYVDLDKKRYRSMLTDDYLLLENGEIISMEKDISLMPAREDEYQRKDSFNFRSVTVRGDIAYLVYFLKSEILDRKNGRRQREYLETLILRRDVGKWRVALLHSTKLTKA